MTDVAIRVENLGKQYKLGGQKSAVSTGGTFRQSLTRLLRKPETGPDRRANQKPDVTALDSGIQTPDSKFWALKGINVEIKRGEAA
ncbi:MAG: hypothetical protein WBA23_06660 [Tunicatimonas sp.]|uniref:hypothetical protein n=1 Tax=Tunicatimonas sp. TaxID=1940096 RepID=UPI003C75B0CE